MQLPQGAMLVKNSDGQLVVVQNSQHANQKVQTVRVSITSRQDQLCIINVLLESFCQPKGPW